MKESKPVKLYFGLILDSIIKSLQGHQDSVFSIALLKNKNLISASRDQTLKIWSLDNGLVKTITSIYDLESIAVLNNGNIAYAYLHYVKIYDINSEKQIIEYYYHLD